ncbi:MAG: hypothetical protein QOI33_3644, partial [Mycobacterium sp.]|nr:hypothetical protein [Mycobacterium sp.]
DTHPQAGPHEPNLIGDGPGVGG